MYVIADIAGNYDALMRLIKKIPKEEKILFLGDMIDRGPDSDKIIEYMASRNCDSVIGNHEHMFLNFFEKLPQNIFHSFYQEEIWMNQGGLQTLLSYFNTYGGLPNWPEVPEHHFKYLLSLPWCRFIDQVLYSHAPLNKKLSISEAIELTDENPLFGINDYDSSLIWNRSEPIKRNFFQVFGHNAHWGLTIADGWICLDQTKKPILTAAKIETDGLGNLIALDIIEESIHVPETIILRDSDYETQVDLEHGEFSILEKTELGWKWLGFFTEQSPLTSGFCWNVINMKGEDVGFPMVERILLDPRYRNFQLTFESSGSTYKVLGNIIKKAL